MLQLLRIVAAIIVVAIGGKGSIVRSESLPFCGNSSNTSTCPGDPDQVQIMYPFWIANRTVDETGNGCIMYPGFQVTCAPNGRPLINISSNLYYVVNVSSTLTIVDVDIDAQECPRPRRNISIDSAPFLNYYDMVKMTFLYNCSRYPDNVVQRMPCLDNHYNISTRRSFAFLDQEISSYQFDWYAHCEEAVAVPVDYSDVYGGQVNYTGALDMGFAVKFRTPVNCGNCKLSGGKCQATNPLLCICPDQYMKPDGICPGPYFQSYHGYHIDSDDTAVTIIVYIMMGGAVLVLVLLIPCIVCWSRKLRALFSRCKRRIKGMTNVEVFLESNYRDLSLQNYKYSDIKEMTNSFKDTLGQGGFGSVFKGKLRNGQLVAVKVLNESKGKGDDFINEVTAVGRTNHVNVVSLLGVCARKKKRALVYEFMPNGSLEKFIHLAKDSNTTSSLLGWEKLYQIALGIARGLEYLHRGCNIRILHLDIKPHNILLDQDFCPKISDFGLSKLCHKRENSVSLGGGLGTPGYTAPEVCSKNLGGVSHKSDVFSYGMMVFEMIGGRKNIDLNVNTSKTYFPSWIYKRLQENINTEVPENNEEIFEEESVKKMTIVALWCTQMQPKDRPSMNEVVDMLERNFEDLKLPPNPFVAHSPTSS